MIEYKCRKDSHIQIRYAGNCIHQSGFKVFLKPARDIY